MDEDKYRETYRTVNPLQCPFEKTLNSRRCVCSKMERIHLADRECAGCHDKRAWQNCLDYLHLLRENARFALKITNLDEPLPHNKEMKVQSGSIFGLQELLQPESRDKPDIYQLLQLALEKYHSLEALPLNKLMPAIVHFEVRPKRRGKKK